MSCHDFLSIDRFTWVVAIIIAFIAWPSQSADPRYPNIAPPTVSSAPLIRASGADG
jgi:hypothetical protein